MTNTLLTPFYAFAALYLLWTLYLAVMNLKRARDAGKLSKPAYVLGLPLLYGGLLLDVLVNLTVCTVILREIPRKGEWTVSQRLSRHVAGSGWRQAIAVWVGTYLLDPYDPSGKHL